MAKDKFVPKSSFIQAAEWDDKSKIMTLTFDNQSQYNYMNVERPTWLSFKQSSDHSSYYARAIKGNIESVPVKRTPVPKTKSTPLKVDKLNRSLSTHGKHQLNAGIKHRSYDRKPGNLPRFD